MKKILYAAVIVCVLLLPAAAMAGQAEATLSLSMTPRGGELSLSLTPEAAQAISAAMGESSGQPSLGFHPDFKEASFLNMLLGFMLL